MPNPVSFPHLAVEEDLRKSVRELTAQFDLAYWDQKDADHEFPEEWFQAFAAGGFMGILIPEEYGGGGGTLSQMAAVLEEVCAGGGGLNASSSVHVPLISTPTLLAHGSEEQRRTLLPQIASGELYVTFGVTEPDAGTDTTKIRTRATKVEGGWSVTGSKVWNTGALRGQKAMVLVRTSDPGPDERPASGMTLMLVNLQNEPAVEIRAIPKIGRNAVPSCEVFINDYFVPEGDVIGEVGRGFYHILDSLNSERLFVAAECIGVGRWLLEEAVRYAKERVVFDRQIGKNQAVQHPLAKNYIELMAAAEILQLGVREYEEKGGPAIGAIANAAKYLASEASFATAEAAMQVFGGFSFAREYHIGRHWIESRLPRVAPVNNQMVLNYIAERTLGLPRSY